MQERMEWFDVVKGVLLALAVSVLSAVVFAVLFKINASRHLAVIPRGVFFTGAFCQIVFCAVGTVKHHFNKTHNGGFAVFVFTVNNVKAVVKVEL